MAADDTKQRIIRKLRGTDQPALSAAHLADELDVSVRTINTHVADLTDEDRIATAQIGNANAYYIPFEDLPTHKKPDHTCQRCGREVDEVYDFARIDTHTYFERANPGPETSDFFVFCRFCYSDFISWVLDPAAMGEYRDVHSWSLPPGQLEAVRADPDVVTNPRNSEYLDEEPTTILEYIRKHEGEDGVPKQELLAYMEEEHDVIDIQASHALKTLVQTGHAYMADVFGQRYKTAE